MAFAVTGCVSISSFTFLVGILIGIASSATIGLKICAITAGDKNYQSIIKKKTKKHDKIVLLNSMLNSMEVFISKALIDSYISHNEYVLVNNVLIEYDDMKEAITVHQRF